MIGLIDYGSGNIHAIATIYHRLEIPFALVKTPREIEEADKLVLPGVGAFDETMDLIGGLGIVETLNEQVLGRGKPVIGVCVGMQVLGDSSEEGRKPGLGWIPGRVLRFRENDFTAKPHLPHMGWNSIAPVGEPEILAGVDVGRGFYFLHSYYFECADASDVLAKADYPTAFACAIRRDNVYGMQFHPEKSHDNGVRLFRNFALLD